MTSRRTPGWRAAVARMTGIVVVTSIVAVGCGSRRQPSHAASASSVTSASSIVSSPAPSTTVAELAHEHWSLLPPAPITPREQAVVAWTGSQLLVWGGMASSPSNDAPVYADGASYDPKTKQWTTLPAAPISAREGMGWVWTGSSLVIFGGEGLLAADGSPTLYNDGAMYTPATNSWRKLAASPLSARSRPQLLWTGRSVLVIGGDPAEVGHDGPGYAVGAAEFLPSSDRWTVLPAMPTPGHDVRHLVAVMTSRGAYVWQMWQQVVRATDGYPTQIGAGTDLAVLDPDRLVWSRPVTTGEAPDSPEGATVVGDQVSVPPSFGWWGDESTRPPATSDGPGHVLNVATNTWSPMLPGPIDEFDPLGVSTGTGLFEYTATKSESTEGSPTLGPGASALWDAATNTWTALPTAPPDGSGDNTVWAGDQLIEWGLVGIDFGPS